MKIKERFKQGFIRKNNDRYQKELSACRQSYSQWIADREAEIPIAGNTRGESAAQEAVQERGAVAEKSPEIAWEEGFGASSQEEPDCMILRSPHGEMAAQAERLIADRFRREPDLKILYGDEDVRETAESERKDPWFKPDWSPDYLESVFYPGSLVAIRKSWLGQQEEAELKSLLTTEAPTIRNSTEYQRVILRCIERAGAYEKGMGRRVIGHIPYVLFHSSSEKEQETYRNYSWGQEKQDKDGGYPAGWTEPDHSRGVPGGQIRTDELAGDFHGSKKLLSVIIPSKDNPELLMQCVRGVARAVRHFRYEIIVVDNGSSEEHRKEIQDGLAEFERHAGSLADKSGCRMEDLSMLQKVCYHYEPMDFHFSRMCNIGAEIAEGSLFLFLNDDVELSEASRLDVMCKRAVRPYTGAVGLKLLYPEERGERLIQHAGITNLPMGPVHKLQFHTDVQEYYFGWNRNAHNALAVTAACLMVERRKFEEAGGFSEELAVAFNDVDFCFSLYESGYENVCECGGYALHRESFSRGDDEAPEKVERLLTERAKLYARHPGLRNKDPYYSYGFQREGLDTGIRPAYRTAGNILQDILQGHRFKRFKMQDLKGYREDACLMVRVESAIVSDGIHLIGWSVVLGDDNSCYEKELLLRADIGEKLSETGEADSESFVYSVPLRGQYRPDLEENMADQKNVGLCGFQIRISEDVLPEGRYLVGVSARSRVARIRLLNWSNRRIENKPGQGA